MHSMPVLEPQQSLSCVHLSVSDEQPGGGVPHTKPPPSAAPQ